MFERTLKTYIEKTTAGFPVLLLTGMRQVGKTTLLSGMAEPERRYVSLDDMAMRAFARRDPEGFIRQCSLPCIIDEVQYAPELFIAIKIWVDEQKRTGHKPKGVFWLTGSQHYHLMKGVQESLAGRVALIDMLGLSLKEINGRGNESHPFLPSSDLLTVPAGMKNYNQLEMFTHIWRGSFPEPIADTTVERETFYRSYIRSYIERDVKDFHGLRDDLSFHDFLRAAAARTGNLLNFSDLCRDVGIDIQTAKNWLSILERSGIIKLLEPYSPNITQRIIKTPKLFFMDTGLASYLAGWDTPESLMRGAQNGAMLETWVFSEILKGYWHNGKEVNIYFYRDRNQKEIDFVIEKNMTLYPIEVKKTASPGAADLKHFGVLKQLGKETGTGAVLCLHPTPMPLERDVVSFPLWEL
ncbi:MAG: ATP-binding protein [Treponema sp.]|jgi:predicted AAA+ superfamily ATPase|nr:ATP-binding protein [Treponema sp.]